MKIADILHSKYHSIWVHSSLQQIGSRNKLKGTQQPMKQMLQQTVNFSSSTQKGDFEALYYVPTTKQKYSSA